MCPPFGRMEIEIGESPPSDLPRCERQQSLPSLAEEAIILVRPMLADILARVRPLHLGVHELPKGISAAGVSDNVRQHVVIAIDAAIHPLGIQHVVDRVVCEQVDRGALIVEVDDVWLGCICGAHGLLSFRRGIVCRPLRLQGHHTACKDVSVP